MRASRWLSANPDKAFAERLYLLFLPLFIAYNAMIQRLGWLDAGTGWHVAQNFGSLLRGLPAYCGAVSDPLAPERGSLNLYMAVCVL
jgi:hypothetical protein